MANEYIAVEWPADGRVILDPRFGVVETLPGSVNRLTFTPRPGRISANLNVQMCWTADILIHLADCGYAGKVVMPA